MMKLLFELAAIALLSTAAIAATDITGKWSGFPIYVTFKQDGNKLTGTAGQSDADQVPLENGTIENDRIHFNIGTMQADLHVDGDLISGEIHEGTNNLKLALRRVKVRDASAPPPAFDVASVKRTPPPEGGKGINSMMRAEPGRITCSNVDLKRLIVTAWHLKDYQVTAPSWLSDERYDIIATMPAGSPPEEVQLMFQTLLTERFKVAVHWDKKEMPVYEMTVDKNVFKFEHGLTAGRTSINGGEGGRTRALTADTSMTSLASTLSNLVDRPVINMTELQGYFHVTFQWMPEDRRPNPEGGAVSDSQLGPSIFTALRETGIKLQPRKAPVDILVVDRAEKVPVEN